MNGIFLGHLQEILGKDQCYTEEKMGGHVTFRTGGAAEYYVRPHINQIQPVLALCRQYEIPWLVIGNGSNLLVGDKGIRGLVMEIGKMADKGIRGLVMEIGKMADKITVEENCVTAEAGAMLPAVSRCAANHRLTGMEFASGIPGSIGGAIVMNAGAYGGEMKQIVKEVKVLTMEGEERILTPEELDFGYRHSCIPKKQYIVLQVTLQLSKGVREEIEAKMDELKEQRTKKQPLEYPSAGSTFKRPEGYFAGKLIQDAGLRGYQVGGAQVSEKHCGFVINKENATSADIRQLILDVQKRVQEQFGVHLETEVKIIGDF